VDTSCKWIRGANPARGILQRPEEQSRTGSCQGSSVAGQPQCPRLWHSSTPNARFLSHSPSAPPPPFTQSPYPPRSLVRAGQTHPHRPRLVVSHSTCPPLSSSPHAHSFVIGPAVIKHTLFSIEHKAWQPSPHNKHEHTHTHTRLSQWWRAALEETHCHQREAGHRPPCGIGSSPPCC
jgi:hypothetical protein